MNRQNKNMQQAKGIAKIQVIRLKKTQQSNVDMLQCPQSNVDLMQKMQKQSKHCIIKAENKNKTNTNNINNSCKSSRQLKTLQT